MKKPRFCCNVTVHNDVALGLAACLPDSRRFSILVAKFLCIDSNFLQYSHAVCAYSSSQQPCEQEALWQEISFNNLQMAPW